MPNLVLDVIISNGTRRVLVDEGNMVAEGCSPKIFQKDIQTNINLIVALCPYVTGELMVREAETPPKKSHKWNLEHKRYKKRPKPDEDKQEMLEFVKEEDAEEQQIEVVAPRGQMSSCILSFEQNAIRENIPRTKLVHKG